MSSTLLEAFVGNVRNIREPAVVERIEMTRIDLSVEDARVIGESLLNLTGISIEVRKDGAHKQIIEFKVV